jgi:DNA adenine methylase
LSNNVQRKPVRPILRWAGSKRQILTVLASYWSTEYERYVEPFCGSSALFFFLGPSAAVLSDSNSALMEFYDVLRTDPGRLWKEVIDVGRDRATYLEMRQRDTLRLSSEQRALRFLYLNRNCFNGLYRTNRLGDFNVPFAASRVGEIPPLTEFVATAELLRSATLRACDFGHTLRNVRRGDFVYLDPPFFVSSRRVFRGYGPRSFRVDDVGRLRRHLDRIDAKGAGFVLSFADCSDVRPISRDWMCRRIRVRRHIAGFADHRGWAYELIISNVPVTKER